MKFYTNVVQHKNYIHHFYIEHGERKEERVFFKPSLGTKTCVKSDWKDINGVDVKIVDFNNIFEMYRWRKENRDTIPIYNDIQPVYQFISREYQQDLMSIPFEALQAMTVMALDIEVHSTEGFPFPKEAAWPVTAITMMDIYNDSFITLGLKEFENKDSRVTYIQCETEEDLLIQFISIFKRIRPDMITGWNTEGFDIPYLVNRSKKLLPNGLIKDLSPLFEIEKFKINEDNEGFRIKGVAHVDYLLLYKKLCAKGRENYRLDTIALIELGEGKLDYHDEFDSLGELYVNDHQKYIEYNIKDVELIALLNQNLSYIETIVKLAQIGRVNFEDAFGSVKIWDILVYNEMLKQKMLASPNVSHVKQAFPGGYVKEPEAGMKENVMVVDITSSYPNQIISGNISPETYIPPESLPEELSQIRTMVKRLDWTPENDSFIDLENQFGGFTETLKHYNVSLLANGEFFKRDKQGLFPKLVANIFGLRVQKKREASRLKNEMKDTGETEELINAYKSADTIQYALKIFMNSFYGVFSNEHFRYFDTRLASAVTTMGQLSIRGPAHYLEQQLPRLKIEYTDTDSLFINLDGYVRDKFKEKYDQTDGDAKRTFCKELGYKVINPIVKDYYSNQVKILNLFKNTYEMDFEAIADKTIFLQKKRYIMQLVHEDGYDQDLTKRLPLKKRGVEIVRSNTPAVIRGELEELVYQMFEDGNNNRCVEFVESFRLKFNKMSFEEIARPISVKGMDKYQIGTKHIPIHVRASHVYNNALTKLKLPDVPILNGDKIKYCYIKTPNILGNQNVIACVHRMPQSILDNIQIDYHTHFEKVMVKPVSGLFKALKWHVEEVNSLEGLFS